TNSQLQGSGDVFLAANHNNLKVSGQVDTRSSSSDYKYSSGRVTAIGGELSDVTLLGNITTSALNGASGNGVTLVLKGGTLNANVAINTSAVNGNAGSIIVRGYGDSSTTSLLGNLTATSTDSGTPFPSAISSGQVSVILNHANISINGNINTSATGN